MDRVVLAYAVAALCALALLWLIAARRWQRHQASRLARRRSARAVDGESEAEEVLMDLGYEILDRQAARTWTIWVDGDPCDIELRADLIVSRDGRRYIAEVKTGDDAPRIANASTRRQLLEYCVAYDVKTVLLVDADAGEVHEVDFAIVEYRAEIAAVAGPPRRRTRKRNDFAQTEADCE
jgi:hypothetical protein